MGDTSDTSETGETGDTSDTPVSPSIQWFDGVSGVDLTPDGATALVQSMTLFDGELSFIDTATGVVTVQTTLGDAGKDMGTAVSADLQIAALYAIPVEAATWSADGGWEVIPSPFDAGCDSDNGGAFDVSDDGAVAVGLLWDGCAPAAFRSTSSGVQLLATLGESSGSSAPTNRATVVSGDGAIAAGFAEYGSIDRSPTRWAADGTGELLDPDNRDAPGEVLSIDYTGATLGIVQGYDGFAWTEAEGLVPMGRLENALPTDTVYPNALSADGSTAFGAVGSEFFTVPTAFAWTREDGMRSLQELAVAAGVVIDDGYWLDNVMAVSDDGTVILGRALDADYAPTTFVMHVPPGTF